MSEIVSYEIVVRLKIISDYLQPEQISSVVGITCDASWKTGDFRHGTTIKEKNSGWILNSRLAKNNDLELHIYDLLERILPYRDNIKLLSEKNVVEVSCVVYSSEIPALYFGKEIISKIGEINASFDIDLYILHDA